MTVKTFIIFLFYKLFILIGILKKNFTKNNKQHKCFSTLMIVNISCAPNKNITMISQESCDTEDWRNDAEIQPCPHWNKLHFK